MNTDGVIEYVVSNWQTRANVTDNVDPRAGRDCATAVYPAAGIADPTRELDVAELFVPYSWMEPVLLENLGLAPSGDGWLLVDDGATSMDGPLPVNPSGGLLGANPIGAAGLVRFAEAAMQVMGQAGEHQVEGVETALATGYGGNAWTEVLILKAERP